MQCFKCANEIHDSEPTFSGLHEKCFLEWFQLQNPSNFTDVAARNSHPSNDTFLEINSSFFHGKFKKYSAVLNGKSYILKVQEHNFPELPATEYLCNQLARYLGLTIPDFFFIRFENAVETFVCENFMQKHTGSNLIHIYHLLELPDEFNCKTLFQIVETKTQRLEEMERFVELTLFDALIGNHDRHGRNLGFIQTQKGFQLAPFYDNPSYLGTEIDALLGAHHEPRGKIYTAESNEPTMIDYIQEWVRLGQLDTINRFKQKAKLDPLLGIVEASFLSAKRKNAIKKLITRRHAELFR